MGVVLARFGEEAGSWLYSAARAAGTGVLLRAFSPKVIPVIPAFR